MRREEEEMNREAVIELKRDCKEKSVTLERGNEGERMRNEMRKRRMKMGLKKKDAYSREGERERMTMEKMMRRGKEVERK